MRGPSKTSAWRRGQLRIKALELDEVHLAGLVAGYAAVERDILLSERAPAKGGPLLRPEHRSAEEERLLGAIAFLMQAATEIGAEGTWRDPDQRAHDDHAANTLIQVEYGETQGERVGNAIVATLRLINDLEVNEQVLYARMENVEESTLS
ncbi:hypothetical protein [Tenggerimyces flavus]|uniref:Uncharacterized protein n=1 Tax=Tenggerimyces flavus TaxID=1708749 RepID=A0ABV7YGR2_9ACTN|nr:hypothetical protein [Tenggerimyces flavus]MBM7783986.1 hypothetical protein [Tenggerimyces flavus]